MTIKNITSVLALTLVATSLFTANVQAKENQTTINFKAAIVASPCTYDINDNKTNLNCFNKETNKMETSKIDFSKEKNQLNGKN